jgi:hypothetical protein
MFSTVLRLRMLGVRTHRSCETAHDDDDDSDSVADRNYERKQFIS